MNVAVAVAVAVGVGVNVAVAVAVALAVAVGVKVAVGLGVNVAVAVGVNGTFFFRLDLDHVPQLLARVAGEHDRPLADVHPGRRGQAERLEELLHGAEAGRVATCTG